jgi:hypothetical protein
MANLLSIAEQAWRQLNPNPTDETATKVEEYIATAKNEYSYQFWLKMKAEKREEGRFDVPGYLMSEKEVEVVDGEMDISGLNALFTLENDLWIQNIGGFACECPYVRTTVNLMNALCDDDSLPSNARRYYVIRGKIKFPDGVHKTTLPIIFANNGENVDERIEVEESLAGIIRRTLIDIYSGKTGSEDKTNDSNSRDN